MSYMLDTNICIYIIKKHPQHVLNHFNAFKVGEICISSVTLGELMYGVEKSQHHEKNRAALEEFILPLDILPFDDDCARHYGRIRSMLEKKGIPIGALDTMIVSHALRLNMTIVTNNMKEFSRVPHLLVENWV